MEDVLAVLQSVKKSVVPTKICVVDHSPNPEFREVTAKFRNAVYVHDANNPGFGAGHNRALSTLSNVQSTYHLVVNPDITYESGVLLVLKDFMDKHNDVGVVMPKVVYKSGRIQRLVKKEPRPADLIFRRFFPGLMTSRNDNYEMRSYQYDKVIEAESISGCFLMLRRSILNDIGMFDERFFMYLEDIDLIKRIRSVSKAIVYPGVLVVHGYEKGSYSSVKLTYAHVISAVKYFSKHGWFPLW
jgi:GT2 family glycosyltransferase